MGDQQSKPDMMDVAIELKINSKMLEKQAKKLE